MLSRPFGCASLAVSRGEVLPAEGGPPRSCDSKRVAELCDFLRSGALLFAKADPLHRVHGWSALDLLKTKEQDGAETPVDELFVERLASCDCQDEWVRLYEQDEASGEEFTDEWVLLYDSGYEQEQEQTPERASANALEGVSTQRSFYNPGEATWSYGRVPALAAAKQTKAVQQFSRLEWIAATRMIHMALLRGWQSWLAENIERQRRNRMVHAAAGRLSQPVLAAVLAHWRSSWHGSDSLAQKRYELMMQVTPTEAVAKAKVSTDSCDDFRTRRRLLFSEHTPKTQQGSGSAARHLIAAMVISWSCGVLLLSMLRVIGGGYAAR